MTLLAGGTYDPVATAVTKATATLAAMVAFDTTNLRRTFTVPANGAVLVHARGVFHGAAIIPQVLVGVMAGATVISRMSPSVDVAGTIAATTRIPWQIEWIVSGLVPGSSAVWDLAFSVELAQASASFKYGGPNNAVSDDAFGGLAYSILTA